MSLVRLLAAGRSLVGLQDMDNRYRMRRPLRLPKFGPTKNPFIERTEAPSLPLVTSANPTPPRAAEKTPAEAAAAALKKTMPLPKQVCAQDCETAKPVKPATKMGLLARISSWTPRLNPFALRSNPARKSKASTPGANPAAVQGELSLDRIKVMRNDLSDADVEIVASKAVVKPKPEPAVKAGKTAELVPAGPR